MVVEVEEGVVVMEVVVVGRKRVRARFFRVFGVERWWWSLRGRERVQTRVFEVKVVVAGRSERGR